MKDKDYPACLSAINKLGAAFYATTVPEMERSLTAERLADAAMAAGTWRGNVKAFANPLDAVAEASEENDVVLVCGSLYFIGWIRSKVPQ